MNGTAPLISTLRDTGIELTIHTGLPIGAHKYLVIQTLIELSLKFASFKIPAK